MGVFKRTRKNSEGEINQYWYIRYWINGKEKKESIGKVGIVTKGEAQVKLEERKRQIRLGQLDIIGMKVPELDEFSSEYIQYQKEVKKKKSWFRDEIALKHLNKIFGNSKLNNIHAKDIDDYKQIRLSSVSSATVNRELEVLRHLYNIAERWNRFNGKNPVSKAGLIKVNNKQERILTHEEEERLLSNCNYYMKNIIICALNTGMRKGEIISVKWDNIDLNNNIITLEHTKTKSKKSRKIPINSIMRKLFLELKIQSDGNEYVFLNSNRKPYTRQDSLNRAFKSALKKANIGGLRFHDLRHTCATRMIENGANIVAVKEILGHSSLDMTMRYAHPEDSLKDAVEKLANQKYKNHAERLNY